MNIRACYVALKENGGWVNSCQRNIDLLYLAWGNRTYGKTVHGVEKHTDWIYIAPQSGSPRAIIDGLELKLHEGTFLIVAPDCTLDMKDIGASSCRIRTWAWKTSPEFEDLHPKSGKYLLLKLSAVQRDEIRALHQLFRYEVRSMDAYSPRALEILRGRLDLCLVRGLHELSGAPLHDRLFTQAIRWMEANAKADAYINDLCDHLRVSESVLNRLFVERAGCSPQKAALRIRLAEAQRLLADGWSVKATAYHLGYKHPNDLSRALSRSLRQ